MVAGLRPVVAIVQARTGSSRFPRKVLEPVLGRPMLLRELERISHARLIDSIIVATTERSEDDELVELVDGNGYDVFRGDEDDVLARFRGAAERADAATVVRLTGDCPLIDPALIDAAVQAYERGRPEVDFVSNALSETYPDGMDTEVFSRALLEQATREATLPSEREHVTFYFWKTGLFRVESLRAPEELGHIRLTVDYPEDLEFVRAVYERLYPVDLQFGLADVLEVLPELPAGPSFSRNAGWAPSLARDQQASGRRRD